jgi:ubiquinone/menaquinone biosynthesis C-methylase UbiE
MTRRFTKPPEGEERLFAQLSFPETYEKALVGPLFQPWAELMLEDIDLAAGDRVLDVACGTGIVARLAKERLGQTGTVVGIDLSPPMLAVARQLAPAIDWREGDASALPLRDNEQFDVVLCQQGLQFFPDRAAAVRQMRRALAAGGRLAVSTWRPDEEMPLLFQLRRVAERHLGAIVDRRHGFGEAGAIEAMLREAGLREVQSRILSRIIRFNDASVFVRLNAMALVSMSPASNAMDDEERERVVAAVMADSAEVVLPHTTGALAFELRANVAMARG